jgi:hypothetical protein
MRSLLLLSLTILAIIIVTAAISKNFSFHLHHYQIGLLIFAFTVNGNLSRYSMVLQALGFGLFINGVSVWGPGSFFDAQSVASVPSFGSVKWTTSKMSYNYYNRSSLVKSVNLVWSNQITQSVAPQPYAVYMNSLLVLQANITSSATVDFPNTASVRKYYFQVKDLVSGAWSTVLTVSSTNRTPNPNSNSNSNHNPNSNSNHNPNWG